MNRRMKKKQLKKRCREIIANMEVGNLLFGHSRGNFAVDRVLQDSYEWNKLLHMTNYDTTSFSQI